MAYGKIKADTFVYDNSGSDAEVTLASLASKVDANNPTLTGTVTIPTPTSGDNSTKAASTAFVVAGFTAKPASAGTVGASEVVQVDANKDTTGIRNLTISGNLQVNGTTTTVDSTTMSVADKNIELAKGAANDAAADGGGITLVSGDGNKTFNWVDATDSWTSSEHIHLGDSKQLKFGSDTDAYMWHDGSNGYFRNTVGSFYLQAKTSENAIRIVPDAEVALFYNNTETFRTDSNGVRVSGTEGQPAYLYMWADEGDDNADKWVHAAETDGTYALKSYSTGSWVTALAVDGSGNVSDAKGNLRNIPANVQTSAVTLAASDAGKVVATSSGGWVIPASTFSTQGMTVTLLNRSNSDQTINATALTSLYNTADGANVKASTLTLGARTMATIWFDGADTGYIQAAALTVS